MTTMEKGTAKAVLLSYEAPQVKGDKVIFPFLSSGRPIKENKVEENQNKFLSAFAAFGIAVTFVQGVSGQPTRFEADILTNHTQLGELLKTGYRIHGFDPSARIKDNAPAKEITAKPERTEPVLITRARGGSRA